MLGELAELYGVPFSKEAGKSLVASLLVDLAATPLSHRLLGSAIRLVPVVGPLLGLSRTTASGSWYANGTALRLNCCPFIVTSTAT